MTPEVIERALTALDMRRQIPQPTWREIAAQLGCAHNTLIESIDRWYAQRDRAMEVARLVEEHQLRRERMWNMTLIAISKTEPPEARVALLAEARAQMELEARELGMFTAERTPAGPITLINNTSQASSNAIAGTTGGTLDDIRAVLGEILMAERSGGGVPLPPMNGNGNGHIADAESAPDEDATQ